MKYNDTYLHCSILYHVWEEWDAMEFSGNFCMKCRKNIYQTRSNTGRLREIDYGKGTEYMLK